MTLKGKVALVTGSTSGIGLGIARAFAGEGASVMLNGFGDAATIEGVKKEIAGLSGAKVGFHGADLSKPTEIEALFAETRKTLGAPDILVNNAGIQHTAQIEDFPPDRWDAVIAINLTAVFHCTRLVLRDMKAKNWGRIINIASAHGLVASVQKSAYVAAKHGVLGLTKVTALETAETGVTCNAICPGWVLTPLVQKQIDALAEREKITSEAARMRLLGEKQPSKAFVTPEQLGGLAVFLCSEAAQQIRGTAMPVDGGWTAQ
jgi:3-hydroxybutyrate dehydrogenase